MARPSSPLPTQDPGLGEKLQGARQRLINRDGTFNVRRTAPNAWLQGDWYHYWVTLSWGRFTWALVGWFTTLNVLFSFGYLALGYEQALLGAPPAPTWDERFLNAFFFSVQTFNSVGYGVISPRGVLAGLLSSFEALVGVLTFAIITGLLYARFSKPKARILFSETAVVTPPDPRTGHRKLMFRIANQRSNTIIEVHARVLLTLARADGTRRYYALPLERDQVMFLPLNWTLVHEIDAESPLYEVEPEELAAQLGEMLILLRGYDDTYAQDIHARSSYRYDEWRWNHRFVVAYKPDQSGELVLDLARLHDTEEATA